MMPEAHPPQHRRHITRSLLFAAGGLFLTAAALAVVRPSAPPEPVFQARQTLDLPPLDARTGQGGGGQEQPASGKQETAGDVSVAFGRVGLGHHGGVVR